jgi:uncharacterized protein (TIGR02001 family)
MVKELKSKTKETREMVSANKKMIAASVVAVSLLGFGASTVLAEEEAPSAEASVAFLSKYVWRGYELSDDSLVIQPSLTASYKGFSANLWGNLDTSYNEEDYYGPGMPFDSNLWNETDFTLSYDGAYEKLGYGVGWIYYSVVGSDTQEFYGTLSYDMLLAPTFKIYYDTDGFAGDWYANLGFGHSFMITDKYSLDLGLSFGYTDNSDWSGFSDGLLSASMSFPIGKYIAITPEIYWSFALSDDASDAFKEGPSGDDNFVYGGVSASFSF